MIRAHSDKPTNGQKAPDLLDLLERNPGCFEPVTAFRIAERSGVEAEISSHIGVSIAVHPVDHVRRSNKRTVFRTTFAALFGPLGSLPPSFNELAMKEARQKSHAFSAFINIFSARLASLFADACEKYRVARCMRWHGKSCNPFIKTILSLAGFNSTDVIEHSQVQQDILLRYAGFWITRTRNAQNLRCMLGDFSGLPVRIEQFRHCWLAVAPPEQSRLGIANVCLGRNTMAGSTVPDRSSSLRIILGPLGYEDYLTLRPDGSRILELSAITRLYAGDGLKPDFQIVLKKEDIPFSRLGHDETLRLGWNVWARTAPAIENSADVIITPEINKLNDEGAENTR